MLCYNFEAFLNGNFLSLKLFSWFRRRQEAERQHKKVLLLALMVLGIVGLIVASFRPPEVTLLDPSERENKVTFNAPFTIHFSQVMKKSSVEAAFKILPEIAGHFEWKDLRTLEYHPDEALTIDDHYRIVIDASARSLWFKTLGFDAQLNFVVTGPPYIQYANPENDRLLPAGAPITVLFDRPMDLSTLTLETEPKIKGSVRPMGLSAFQYIPDSLPANRELTLRLPAGIKSLDGGATQEDFELEYHTPNLSLVNVTPKNGATAITQNQSIEIEFSHTVDLNDIRPGLNVLLYPSNDLDVGQALKNDGFFNTEVTHALNEEGNPLADTLIFAPSFPYRSDTEYRLVLKAEGGFGLTEDYELMFSTATPTSTNDEGMTTEETNEPNPESATVPQRKMRWEGDDFMDFFVVGEHPRLKLAEPLTESFWLSVCPVASSQFMRVQSQQGWEQFDCENEAKQINPVKTPFGKELNLAEHFNIDWVHGVYYASLQTETETLNKLFFIEDVSLLLKRSGEDVMVWATDIKSGAVIPDMEIELFNFDGELQESGTTNDSGVYLVRKNFDTGLYVRGRKGDESKDYFGISSDVWLTENSTEMANEPSGLMLITNQNVFEPGDPVKVQGIWRILNNKVLDFPEASQVTLSLEDEAENLLTSTRVPLRRNGSFDGSLMLPDDTPGGHYHLSVRDINQQLLAEQLAILIRHKRPEVELEWVTAASDQIADEAHVYIAKAHYENGLPAGGIQASYQLYARPFDQTYQEGAVLYNFNRIEDKCDQNCHSKTLFSEGSLSFDDAGEAKLILTDRRGGFLPAGYEYELQIQREDNTLSKVFRVHQGEFALGLGLKHATVELGEAIEASLISQQASGNPSDEHKVLLSLIRQSDAETVYQDSVNVSGRSVDVLINQDGALSEGVYVLRASAQDSKHNEVRAERHVYIFSEQGSSLGDEIIIAPDQPKYFVGGRAHLIISDPTASEDKPVPVIVSYERRGLLDYEIVLLKGPITRVTVPIQESMMPHFLVKVTRFYRGLSPRYASDSAIIEVGNDLSEINVKLSVNPPNPRAGDEVTLHIKTTDYQGLPLSTVVTLNALLGEAVMDKALWLNFFAESPNAMETSSNITLRPMPDGQTPEGAPKKPFQPNVPSFYFDPLITTSEAGEAELKLIIPEAAETLGLRVIATKEKTRFGVAEMTLPLSQRLYIRPIMPSFVIPGDQTFFGASIKNVSDQEVSSRLELITLQAAVLGDSSRNFTLKPGQQVSLNFKVLVSPQANDDELVAHFRSAEDMTEASVPFVGLKSTQDLVENSMVSEFWTGRVAIPEDSYPNVGSLRLLMSGSPEIFSAIYAEALEGAEYQSTDLLARKLIARTSSVKADDEATLASVRTLVTRLLNEADYEGAYHYWNERKGSPRVTALSLFALKRAMNLGVHIDSLLLSRSMNYLWDSLDEGVIDLEDQPFVLWALGQHENYDTERSLDLFSRRDELSLTGRAFLLMNLSQIIEAGQKSVVPVMDRLQSEMVDLATSSGELSSFSDSLKQSTLMIYALASLDNENALLSPLLNFVSSHFTQLSRFFDPQLATWTILAIEALDKNPKTNVNYIAQAKVNGETVMDHSLTSKTLSSIFESKVHASVLSPSGVNDIFVKKEGDGPLYFAAHFVSYADPKLVKRIENDLLIVRSLYHLADDGQMAEVSSFKKGQRYAAKLEFIVPEDMGIVALTEPIPAGFRLNGADAVLEGSPFESLQADSDAVHLYAPDLKAGVYQILIPFEAVLSGSYQMLPARIQGIFAPAKLGLTEAQTIDILE